MEEVAKEVVGDTEMKVDMVEVEVEVVKCSNQFPQFASSAVMELCKYQLSAGYKYLPRCYHLSTDSEVPC